MPNLGLGFGLQSHNSIISAAAALPTPSLATNYTNKTITITNTGSAPDHWAVYKSTDGSSFPRVTTLTAGTTTFTGVPGAEYFIRGETSGNANTGNASNTVLCGDTTDISVTLSTDSGNPPNLSWSGWDGASSTAFNWLVFDSSDGGTSWSQVDSVAGNVTGSTNATSGNTVYVVAVDLSNNPISGQSNHITA